jgi:hypothetical protein
VDWVAVPQALRARRVNRRPPPSSSSSPSSSGARKGLVVLSATAVDACTSPRQLAQLLRIQRGWAERYSNHADEMMTMSMAEPPALDGGAAAVASLLAAVLTEIYLCNVCSGRAMLRGNGRG